MDQITESIGIALGLVVFFVVLRNLYWRVSKKERPVPSELHKLLYLVLVLVWIFGFVLVTVRD